MARMSGPVQPLWSVDLRPFGGRGALVDSWGRLFTWTDAALISFTVDGRVSWQASLLGPAHGPLLFAPDGALLRIEGDALVTRDGGSGQVIGTFAIPHVHWFTLDPWGGILLNEMTFDAAGHSTAVLHRTDRSGAQSWSVALATPLFEFPTVLGDRVLVQSGGLLRALDSSGQVQWAAGHDGFHPPQTVARDRAVADGLWYLPLAAGSTSILVGFEGYALGRQLFLIDPVAHTVSAYAPWLVPRHPALVMPTGESFRVAIRGTDRELRQLEYDYSVVCLDETGNPLWEHRLDAPPKSLLTGVGDAIFVAATPSHRRWNDYHHYLDLSDETFIRCLGPDGTPRWTWFAPGPLGQPRLGPDGSVHVMAGDWLIGLPGS
jgi:outer membrane protein assembly factor BamB